MKVDDANSHVYTYDVIYQLVFVDYNNGNSTDYFYDSLGNRTDVNESGTITSYSRNELNQYTSVGGEDYDYDDNGNLIDVNTGEYEFAYDCENRLIAANSPDANVTFGYDYLGRRVKKAVEGGATNKYCYDGDQVIAEYENDVLARKFIYGPGIDEPICMIDVTDNNEVYYYHFDGLGSVVGLTDSVANVVERYSYDVFGEPNRVSDVNNPYMFTGRRYDSETVLYYYRARYYSTKIGRFLQTDPISYEDGINLYAYCGNNPIIFLDPLGLCGDGGGVGHPGFWEGMIPIWGSGRNAIAYYQEGRWFWGTVHVGLAISDVFLVKAAVTGIAKGIGKGFFKTGSHSWRATGKWLTKTGRRQFKGQHIHHWAFQQGKGLGKYVPEAIKNQPLNLIPMKSAAFHTRLHGMGIGGRLWYGTPTWMKAATVSGGGRAVNIFYNSFLDDETAMNNLQER